MKKTTFKFKLILLSLLFAFTAKAQYPGGPKDAYTPSGIFDTLFDKYGNKYALADLRLPDSTSRTMPNGKQTQLLCASAGYFNLWFENGSGMELSGSPYSDRRAVLCQLFSDISNFVTKNINTNDPNSANVKVNIWIRDITQIANPPTGILGLATAFYVAPNVGNPSIGGILDNQVWKTIISGSDAYDNITSPLNTIGMLTAGSGGTGGSGAAYFHGMMAFNFSDPNINWETQLTSSPNAYVNGPLYDLYTVALHEMTHALGFSSIIDYNGTSKFGTNYANYYSRYDLKLETQSGQHLITNSGSCSMYNYGFNSAISAGAFSTLSPNPSTCGGSGYIPNYVGSTNSTNCSYAINYVGSYTTVPVYTQDCFLRPSSLSHFEDQCYINPSTSAPYGNDVYFTMSNANGTGLQFYKRYLKEEEKSVLCDLGYTTSGSFGGSSVDYSAHTYSSSCTGIGVAGVNDGISSTGSYVYTANAGSNIVFSGILGNDYNASTFECLQVLYPATGSVSVTSGNNSTSITYTPPNSYPGAVLLRYVPISSTGVRGDITYVYLYEKTGGCTPTTCNALSNGTFEATSTYGGYEYCGSTADVQVNLGCWTYLSGSPDLYIRGCTVNTGTIISSPSSTVNVCDVGGNYTNFNSPNLNNHPLSIGTNDKFMGIGGDINTSDTYGTFSFESGQTTLNSPLINGNAYILDFWAAVDNYDRSIFSSSQNKAGALDILVSNSTLAYVDPHHYISGVLNNTTTTSYIQTIQLPYSSGGWQHVAVTFTYTGPSGYTNLIIANNLADASAYTSSPGPFSTLTYTPSTEIFTYIFVDDITITDAANFPIFTPPTPICQNTVINNIQTYGIPSSGTVTGTGITGSSGSYTFTSTGLSGDVYLGYDITNGNGCTYQAVADVYVNTMTLSVTPTSTTMCNGNFVYLTASGASTYSWSPSTGLSATTGSIVAANPTTSTTYTVVGTNTVTGCASTVTVNVNINPTPTVVIKPVNPICSGQSVSLGASGVNTYTWSTGANTSSITVTPTVTTTYTVTGTSTAGCISLPTTITVTVTPTPTITISYNPSASLCLGQTETVTASGASTYSWSTGATTASIIATPTVTGVKTLTVTGTSAAGCTNTAVATVTISALPEISVGVRGGTLCGYGDYANLSASGGSTYSWTPSSTLSSSTGAAVTATPTVTTTYTVTGTSAAGCSNTATVTVTVLTNSCSNTSIIPTYTPAASYTLSGNPIYLSSDISVGSGIKYEINSADVRIKPNLNIHVASGGTLTIMGSWLHSCSTCGGGMWNGINVDGGGTVNMITGKVNPAGTQTMVVDANNIIEDAITVLTVNTASTAATWSITNTIFNNDGTGIFVNSNSANLSGGVINNCVFTCRSLGNHATTVGTWTATVADIQAATTQTLSTANPIDNTLAGYRTQYGINAVYTNSVYPIVVGAATYTANTFDNLDIGINSYYANMKIQNNRFQNLTGNTAQNIGIGVYCNMNGTPAYTLTVGGSTTTANTFTNCLSGITTYSANRVYIDYNNFNNEVTAPASTASVSGNYVIGYSGVYNTQYASGSSTVTPEGMSFTNNKIQNCNVGLSLDIAKLYNTGDGSTPINTNTITAAGTSSQYCNQGIYLQQTSAMAANTGVPQDAIAIASNSVTNCAINAIAVNSVNSATATTGFVEIDQNTELSVKYNSAATTTVSPHIAAVYVAGSNHIKVDNNTKIQCTGLTSYTNTNVQYIAGIYISTSPSSTVNCNTVKYVGEGFVWEGASPSSNWYKNNVQNSRYGLVLRNSGVMGDQGSSGHPSGNVFGRYISTNITDAQTLADNTNPGLSGFTSKLFVTSSLSCSSATTYSPCQNNGGSPYSASTLSVTTGSFPCACTGDCGNGRMAYNNSTMSDTAMTAADSLLLGLENILTGIENGDPFPVYDMQTRWALQYYVATQNDSLPAAAGYENAKTFAQADAAISGGNYTTAQTLLNSVSSNNVIEDNWLLVDNLQLKLQNDTLDSIDVVNLNTVAVQCPLIGGNIVYEARALLNNYYKHLVTYVDNCNDDGNGSRKSGIQSNKALSNSFDARLFPNPNAGNEVYINTTNFNAGTLNIKLTDLEGRIVFEKNCDVNESLTNFKMAGIKNGVYFVSITNTKTGEKIIKKLVIQY